MPKVIVSADVANGAEWEGLFRTHGDLFQKQRVTNIDFAIDGNHVVCCFDTEDLDTYMQHFQSEETAAAMGWHLAPSTLQAIEQAIAARGRSAANRIFI